MSESYHTAQQILSPADLKRYWAQVDRRTPDECWPWQGKPDYKGYGRLSIHSQTVHVHRIAWELARGPLPEHVSIRHTCHLLTCVNPSHLYLKALPGAQIEKRDSRDCSVPLCSRPYYAAGFCRKHYDRKLNYGSSEPHVPECHKECKVDGCSKRRREQDLCDLHAKRLRKYGSTELPPKRLSRYINSHGYVLTRLPNHPNAQKDGYVSEHILVMSKHLGRPVLPTEQIHHKNGIRHDNRLENLELWSVSHPSGQRVTDLVAFARDILAQYGDLVDKGDLT